jgi:transposase
MTAVCVVNHKGDRLWEGECGSSPDEIALVLHKYAPEATSIGLETGPLAVWHWHGLRALGFPMVCLHARHAHAAIAMQVNRTDRNDAHALAQIMRTGWYRAVELKSMESHRIRVLLSARARIVSMGTTLYDQIRGLLKTFGVVLPPARGGRFREEVRRALEEHPYLADAVGLLLGIWETLTVELRTHN